MNRIENFDALRDRSNKQTRVFESSVYQRVPNIPSTTGAAEMLAHHYTDWYQKYWQVLNQNVFFLEVNISYVSYWKMLTAQIALIISIISGIQVYNIQISLSNVIQSHY